MADSKRRGGERDLLGDRIRGAALESLTLRGNKENLGGIRGIRGVL